LEGGKPPILSPGDLADPRFAVIPYGLSLLLHVTKTLQDVLADMHSGELALFDKGANFANYRRLIGMDDWARVQDDYRTKT